jgi:hypothetical protein
VSYLKTEVRARQLRVLIHDRMMGLRQALGNGREIVGSPRGGFKAGDLRLKLDIKNITRRGETAVTWMSRRIGIHLPLVLFVSAGCSHIQSQAENPQGAVENVGAGEKTINREVAQVRVRLPDQSQWESQEEFVRTLDLSQEGTTLSLSGGGTSIYAVVNRGDRPIAAVIPKNTASVLSGEIMSFHLARALGVPDLAQPGFYHLLTGPNLEKFKTVIPLVPYPPLPNRKDPTHPKPNPKEENRLDVLKQIEQSPGGIATVVKIWDAKPAEYEPLVDADVETLEQTHVLPGGSAPVATLLRCDGPQPSTKTVSFNRGKTVESKAIRQLSNIFLIDAMMGQWDRFSGGNLQTVTKDGEVRFFAVDNGGTNGSLETTKKYFNIVSRFDQPVAERILELDQFLNGKQTPKATFLGLSTEADFLQAMNVDALPKDKKLNMEKFKQAVHLLAEHIRSHANCYFE